MRKLKLTSLLIGLTTMMSFSNDNNLNKNKIEIEYKTEFEKGWEDGYCEGWKDVKGKYAYCPYAPYAPYPAYDCKSYRCGYNRGFKAGRRKALNN